MARPIEYNEEVLAAAAHYRDNFAEDGKQVIPTLEGLAIHLKVSRDTVYDWAKNYSEFSYIVSEIRTAKSFQLQNGALDNKLNASVAKLLLGHEGYRENHDVTSDGKQLPTPILSNVSSDDSNKESSAA